MLEIDRQTRVVAVVVESGVGAHVARHGRAVGQIALALPDGKDARTTPQPDQGTFRVEATGRRLPLCRGTLVSRLPTGSAVVSALMRASV